MLAEMNWNIDPIFIKFGNLELGYYGICWLLAFASSYVVLKYVFRREQIEVSKLNVLLVYVFIGSFLGARLGHCLFYEASYYLSNPLEILLPIAKSADGWKFVGYRGLASHGGVLGVVVALLLFSKRWKFNLWDLLDKLGLVAPLGGAFIRLGNFFNSEIIGMPTDTEWGVVFERIDALPRHPSQLYEAAAYLLIFCILFYLYKRSRDKVKCGWLSGVSLTLIFVARLLIEFTKEVQESFEIGLHSVVGMNMGQLLSIPFIIFGVIVIIKRRK